MLVSLVVLGLLQTAQPKAPRVSDSAVVVVPGPEHGGGRIHQFLLGQGWRRLWTTPIRVPVANLDTMAGGLTAYDRGGHAQTLSLRFATADNRIYSFRSVDKNPSQRFSGLLRFPLTVWFANDQISEMFPTGAIAVGELERAAGLLPTERGLAVLPDSPGLGKWRDEFKGLLGIFERRYNVDAEARLDIPGALELISSDTLYPRLQHDGTSVVDQPRYLTARLFDLVVGDWDRHPDQWTWVRFDHDSLRWWVPYPRDRDWALSRFDGVINDLLRFVKPSWTEFGPRYGSIRGLAQSAEGLDRRLLTRLDRAAWDTAVSDLRIKLSNDAIAQAMGILPREFDRKILDDVANSLRLRRDGLPEFAAQYYRRLAKVVDVRASDDSELVEVRRAPDGALLLEIFTAKRVPVYRREFVPAETREIRLYLLGGSDSVRVLGQANGVPLRLITGAGNDVVLDSTGGNELHVYDDLGTATVRSTGSIRHTVRPFESPVPPNHPGAFFRDWGRRFGLAPWLGVRPELGAIVGGGPVFTFYGFRNVPYRSQLRLRLGTTTKAGELNADLRGDMRFERPDRRIRLEAAALNADVIRYFGLGNETVRTATSGFHNVIQRQYSAAPTLELGIGGPARVELGGLLRWSETDEERITQLSIERPYGTGSFTEAGLSAAVVYDSRDDQRVATKGVTLTLTGRVFPALLDVQSAFSSVSLVGTTYLTAHSLPLEPTLAVRMGAQRLFGSYPFFEAANIGGRVSLRGLTDRRYAGDAALYGNSDLRFRFAKSWGILTLADLGRVFLDGESSKSWRVALGGGLWIAPPGGKHMVSAVLAGSGERLRLYVHTGFHF
jgi:surface antigen Omp85-like protein